MNCKILGCGGIGTWLAEPLCRYLNYKEGRHCVTFIDGDTFVPENSLRQSFGSQGKKARVKAGEIASRFRNLSVRDIAQYVTKENIGAVITKGDTVFLCVDNHQTRKLVSDYCQKLDCVVLISGGNELTDGNIQTYIKCDGLEICPPITYMHPEIANPDDSNPGEMSCEELSRSVSGKQIIFTNFMAAACMLDAFFLIEEGRLDDVGEMFFDLLTGSVKKIPRRKSHD